MYRLLPRTVPVTSIATGCQLVGGGGGGWCSSSEQVSTGLQSLPPYVTSRGLGVGGWVPCPMSHVKGAEQGWAGGPHVLFQGGGCRVRFPSEQNDRQTPVEI